MNIPLKHGRITALTTRHDLSRVITWHYERLAAKSRQADKFEQVFQIVCEEYGVPPERLRERGRPEWIAFPRQVAMTIAVELKAKSKVDIARFFNRNHKTVYVAMERVKNRMDTEPTTRERIQTIKQRINNEMPTSTGNLQPAKP